MTTATLIIKLAALLLWCYAAVLAVAWARAVGAAEKRYHVGHVLGLMGVFVPLACVLVITVMIGAVIGLPSIVGLLAVMVPAGLVVGLQLEVTRIVPTTERREMSRLGISLVLCACILLYRGGV